MVSRLRLWLAAALLLALVAGQTVPEEEEVPFTERVPTSWLRPIPIEEEEEEVGFTERVPASWLRPVPLPEGEEALPPVQDAPFSAATAKGPTEVLSSGSDVQKDEEEEEEIGFTERVPESWLRPIPFPGDEELSPVQDASASATSAEGPTDVLSPGLDVQKDVEEEEETGFTERVPTSWLRPVPLPEDEELPPVQDVPSSAATAEGPNDVSSSGSNVQKDVEEEEEELGFTERVPTSWLRPIPFPGDEELPPVQDASSSAPNAEGLAGRPSSGVEARKAVEEEVGFIERVPITWPRPMSPVQDASSSTANIEKPTNALSSAARLRQKPTQLSIDYVQGKAPPSSGPDGTIPSSSGPEEYPAESSGDGGEETATRAVPAGWQPELPPPEDEEGDEEGLEGRQPPPAEGQTRVWATPSRVAAMEAQLIVTDTELDDYGKFELTEGVTGEFASPGYPGEYPPYVWNTWEFLTSDAGGELQLSCDVIELGAGDFVMVRTPDGERRAFHSHERAIEASANDSMVVEFRSDREDQGRLHCAVRAGGKAAPAPAVQLESEELQRVDLNYPSCGKTKFNPRIVGGTEPPPHAFPWLVAVQTRRSKRQFCGGTVINERFVLTAAHCVDRRKPTGLAIAVAKHKRKNDPTEVIFNVKRIIMHEKYNRATQDRDLGMIELSGSLRSLIADKRGWVRPICLPRRTCRSGNNCYAARSAILAGWGLLDSTLFEGPAAVQYVKVPVLSNRQCQKNYAKDRIGITSRMLCAGLPGGGKDSCQGDSGGPMSVVSADEIHTLAGVVSFGKGCALPGYPGVYVRVSEFIDWIREKSRL